MLDRLAFVLHEASIALRRNGFMTFAAISTVAVSLFLLGGLGYSYYRAIGYASAIPGKFDMRAYLRTGTEKAEISETAATIRAISGVASVNWIPRDKAWEREREQDPANTTGIDNPYPDAFKITIKQLSDGDSVAAQVGALKAIDPDPGVVYLRDEQHLIDEGLQVMRWVGLFIAGLLFLTAGVSIFNAINLTIVNRRREIRIMQLVGASRFTVQCPFVIEGVVQGFIGGCISALMLDGAQQVFQRFLVDLDARAALTPFPLFWVAILLGATGGVYGFLCSSLAVAARNRNQ